MTDAHPILVLAAAYLIGAVPFSGLVARRLRGVDLRAVDTGTVSGTSLYRVAGFGPLVIGGVLDVAKGTVGPLLAGNRPVLAAAAAGLAVAGHNWSIWLGFAGGRGISPALGALLVIAWPGTVLLLASLAIGRLLRATGLVSFLGQSGLTPLLAVTGGWQTALAGGAIVLPMWAKRMMGNERADPQHGRRVHLYRLLFDRDPPAPARKSAPPPQARHADASAERSEAP